MLTIPVYKCEVRVSNEVGDGMQVILFKAFEPAFPLNLRLSKMKVPVALIRESDGQVGSHMLAYVAVQGDKLFVTSMAKRRNPDAFDHPIHPVYLPIGENGRMIQKTVMVHAIGSTVEKCIHAFAQSLDAAPTDVFMDQIEPEDQAELEARLQAALEQTTVVDKNFMWGASFSIYGTNFKAAGIYVPGGAVMTWWK